MVSFSPADLIIIFSFFALLIIIGMIPKRELEGDSEAFLLSNRNVGLLLFVMTNVATWYGGILGVGEFTYRYGLLSWFTQGLPYYLFAIIFAFLFAKKIRNASLFTIPDKLEQVYGREAGILSSIIVFVLVSPAPYLLMVGSLFSLMFNLPLIVGLILGVFLSGVYLFRGGYKADLYTDVFQFIVMFAGFILVVIFSYNKFGGYSYLSANLPPAHLKFTGNVSIVYVVVWFLIALWTFADPGFHQRCYAAKSGDVAKKGILISIILFAAFDFLTTTTGLYSKAVLPNLANPVLSFPMFAEKALGPGIKGLFYAAMFATIMSTLNSFLFLSATTFGRDFIFKLSSRKEAKKINYYTRIGLLVSSILSIIIAYTVQSVISIWYVVGSICIPPIIILITGAYFEKFKISKGYAVAEIVASITGSIIWLIIKDYFTNSFLQEVEPMIVGLLIAIGIHLTGLLNKKRLQKETAFKEF
jgi:solute:Na+ symporter, SSS family